MMKKQIAYLLIVLNLILALNAWTQSVNTQACISAPGNPYYFQDSSSKVPLNTQNIFIGSAINLKTMTGSPWVYTQEQYKYYIKKNPGDGGSLTTSLLIKKINLIDGTEQINQTPLDISNNYEVVDADGSLALLKQTIGSSVFLTLNGLTDTGVVQIKSYDITSILSNTRIIGVDYYYSNQLLSEDVFAFIPFLNTDTKILTVYAVYYNSGSLNFDTDTPFYTCTVSSATSAIYPNYNYALEFDGITMHTYLEQSGDRNIPYVQVSNLYDTSSYSNYYLLGTQVGFKIAFWSDDLKNAAWIYLKVSSSDNTQMEIIGQLKIANTNANQLMIFHDHSSLIMFVNIQTSTINLYINTQIDQWKHYQKNDPADDGNTELINDFSSTLHLSYTFYLTDDLGLLVYYYFHLYSQEKIIKYTFTYDYSQKIKRFWNKNYEVSIDTTTKDVLTKQGESFEILLKLKCMCSSTSVTSFTCFYQNDNCVFTVQTQTFQCQPSLPQ